MNSALANATQLALLTSAALLGSLNASAAPIRFELRESPGHRVALAADFLDWESLPMTEESPGLYAVQLEEPWRRRMEYKFLVDDHWQEGPNRVRDAVGFREDPWLSLRPGTIPMAEEHFDFQGRAITVLKAERPSVTLYFQDGPDYLEQGHVRELLANLATDASVAPITAVFIPSHDRMTEYARSPLYADFVAQQLVPEVERRYPTTGGSPRKRMMLGASMGGLISLYTSLRHPRIFALAASQSGSLWWDGGALRRDLAHATGMRFFLDCGTYESSQMLEDNRQGAKTARQGGANVTYREYPSTHDWLSWRNRLQETLRALIGV